MSIGILPACGSSAYRYRAYQIQSPLPPTPATLLGADDIWMTTHNGVDPPRSNPMFITWILVSVE